MYYTIESCIVLAWPYVVKATHSHAAHIMLAKNYYYVQQEDCITSEELQRWALSFREAIVVKLNWYKIL